ncbi:hypothetical protein [Candidatus Entotheonella palauensis]|uniref:hypothetical protein n=1 Tax=Candidatus Entotheonella palauensis TaxID=93172 RepID=UPI000B7D9971|nr:hypothetical protein [Candidatus Entotheonella palauensis]
MRSDKDRIEERVKEIKNDKEDLRKEIKQSRDDLSRLLEYQVIVEDMINRVLIPETQENDFKFNISVSFTLLVGLVIIGFFVMALIDEGVRHTIFSSESGIQFLTLFSLVIAIILFGITGILEAKELAALLGGISGYILGRATTTSGELPRSRGERANGVGGDGNGGGNGSAGGAVAAGAGPGAGGVEQGNR